MKLPSITTVDDFKKIFPTENINHLVSVLIVQQLIEEKITQFYIAPGMRNVPLIWAILQFHKLGLLHYEVVVDERSMAYRALGFSKTHRTPAVLVCTSGTAMANFLPAVIEGSKTEVPLIILTADRPHELIHSDDNQTLDQTHFFRPYVQFDMTIPAMPTNSQFNEKGILPSICTDVCQMIMRTQTQHKSPVHLNIMFRTPLENTPTKFSPEIWDEVLTILKKGSALTHYHSFLPIIPEYFFQSLNQKIESSKSLPYIIFGPLSHQHVEYYREDIEQFIHEQALNFQFYFDGGSSLKYQHKIKKGIFPTFDHHEVQQEFILNPPPFIIHLGGRVTSQSYYQMIEKNSGVPIIHINALEKKEDPKHRVHEKYLCPPGEFLRQWNSYFDKSPRLKVHLNENENDQDPTRNLKDVHYENFLKDKIHYLENAELSFPVVSKTFLDRLPDNSYLYLANSVSVRTFDAYYSFEHQKNVHVFQNRGVSGIEGLISSAIGVCDALSHLNHFTQNVKQPNTNQLETVYLAIGDVSLIHDFNALFQLSPKHKVKLKILLLNNFGGAIFTLLPIQKEKDVLNIITSPHGHQFSELSKLFPHIRYQSVKKREELIPKLDLFFYGNSQSANQENMNFDLIQHEILEVFIDDSLNQKVYDYLKTLKDHDYTNRR